MTANPTSHLTGPRVATLVYDGLCTFEFGIAAEIFGLPRPEFGTDWYRFASCAVDPGPVRAAGGLHVAADQGLEGLEDADLIVVPGWRGADAPVPSNLSDCLRRAHDRGAHLVSICSGAFVLAATGLLDGRTATTHWRYADLLREKYPAVTVDETSLYRHEERLHMSAGSAAGIDLLLELVRLHYGAAKANSVARRLVMPAHRAGGQAQFIERPVACRRDTDIAPVQEQVRRQLQETWTIRRMAALCHMSPRTFQRRFQAATGHAPGDWLTLERIEAAKDILGTGQDDMETVANLVGFGSAHTLRHHFRQRLRLSPTDYRSLFRKTVS